jgi:hypothetical protein
MLTENYQWAGTIVTTVCMLFMVRTLKQQSMNKGDFF